MRCGHSHGGSSRLCSRSCGPKQNQAGRAEVPVIELVKNPDIAATLGVMKMPGQTLVGFALETDNEQSNARDKIVRKNLDMIVLNSLRDKGAGFRNRHQ